jgi:DNA-directed RNA polymerase subunit L
MKLKLISSKKDSLVLEFSDDNETFSNLIRGALWRDGCDDAYYKIEHPLIGKPKLFLEKKDGAMALLEKTAKRIMEEGEEFSASIK